MVAHLRPFTSAPNRIQCNLPHFHSVMQANPRAADTSVRSISTGSTLSLILICAVSAGVVSKDLHLKRCRKGQLCANMKGASSGLLTNAQMNKQVGSWVNLLILVRDTSVRSTNFYSETALLTFALTATQQGVPKP